MTTCSVADLPVNESLPIDLFIFLNNKFLMFRSSGSEITKDVFDRLISKGAKHLFIRDAEKDRFRSWTKNFKSDSSKLNSNLKGVINDANQKLSIVFQAEHPDQAIAQVIMASKKVVKELIRLPIVVKSLAELQTRSNGTVQHSINVSVLSTYLAMQIGYSHEVILEHVGLGGLLHDVGKSRLTGPEEFMDSEKFDHPRIGAEMLERSQDSKISNEVKMIVAQHHECYDGSGYPKKLQGSRIYDLAKIVSIADDFDDFVAGNKITGTLAERQKKAVMALADSHEKYDPKKFEKIIKILRLGV